MKTQLSNELIAIALGTPGPKGTRGLPLLIWGDPGSAKTTLIEQAVEALDEPCITLTPQHDETTYGIVPFVSADYVSTPAHQWTQQFRDRGVVILDDLTSHAGPVQAAQLRLVTHRETGSARLGANVAVIAIANQCAQAANGRPLSDAMANRFIHVPVEMPWASVAQYLLDAGEDSKGGAVAGNLRGLIDKIQFSWDHAYAIERRRMAAFIVARGPAMDASDERDDIDATIRASARSVELCTRAITAARLVGAESLIPALIGGSIGRGHAHAYIEYAAKQDLPTDDAILTTWEPQYGRADVAFVVLGRLVALLEAHPGAAKVARYWHLVERCTSVAANGGAQIPPDVIVPSAKKMAKLGHLPPYGTPSRVLREVIL
jgi:hypothetical protein